MPARDLITIEKANGARLHAIRASVHPYRVIILDRDNPGVAIPLERGDHITRTTPHGLTDTFEVTLPNYTTCGPEGSQGYQAHVRYIHARPARRATPAASHTSIEVRGDHAQIRMHSADHIHHNTTTTSHHTDGWRACSPYRLEEDARTLQNILDRMTTNPDGTLAALVTLNQRVIELNARGHAPEEIAQELIEHPDASTHDARHGLWQVAQREGGAMLNNLGSNAVFAMLMYVLGFGS